MNVVLHTVSIIATLIKYRKTKKLIVGFFYYLVQFSNTNFRWCSQNLSCLKEDQSFKLVFTGNLFYYLIDWKLRLILFSVWEIWKWFSEDVL